MFFRVRIPIQSSILRAFSSIQIIQIQIPPFSQCLKIPPQLSLCNSTFKKKMEKIWVAVRVRPPICHEHSSSTFWRVDGNQISLHKLHDSPISGVSYAFGKFHFPNPFYLSNSISHSLKFYFLCFQIMSSMRISRIQRFTSFLLRILFMLLSTALTV